MVLNTESQKLTSEIRAPSRYCRNTGFKPKRAQYEPSGGKPTTLCRSRWFSAVTVKKKLFDHPPDTAPKMGFQPNGAEYEPSGGKPTALCRSREFSAMPVKCCGFLGDIKHDHFRPQTQRNELRISETSAGNEVPSNHGPHDARNYTPDPENDT